MRSQTVTTAAAPAGCATFVTAIRLHAEPDRDDRGPGGRTAVHAGPTALAVDEARAEWLDTPAWLKNGASTANYAYQIEPSGDPESVVSTKANSGDPICSEQRGGSTWLHQRIRRPRLRRTPARADRTRRRPWLRSGRARH